MRLFVSIILLFISLNIGAQQGYQFSQYMLDKYQFNPAYAGLERSLHINVAVRTQWSGIPPNPQTQYLNAHMPFYIWNGSIGMSLSNETIGQLRNVAFSSSYNRIQVTPIGLFSFGGSIGILQKSIDGSSLITPEGSYTDNTVNHNDPTLGNIDYNGIAPTWSVGFYFVKDEFESGISIANMPAPSLSTGFSDFKLRNIVSVYAEYSYLLNESIELRPNFLLKSDLVETQLDISSLLTYNGNIFGSMGVRGYSSSSIDALIFMGGTKLNDNYSIAYSFGTGLSALKRANEGSHEIRLIYNLNRPIATGLPPKIIYNPRFL